MFDKPITFSRVLLQGREGFDAQAARLPNGDVLVRIPHECTLNMHAREIEDVMGVRNGAFWGRDYVAGDFVLLKADTVLRWDPNYTAWSEAGVEHGIFWLCFAGQGQKLDYEAQNTIRQHATFPPPLGHFHDKNFIRSLVHLAQDTGAIWGVPGFITKYAILGPDHFTAAIEEGKAIHAQIYGDHSDLTLSPFVDGPLSFAAAPVVPA